MSKVTLESVRGVLPDLSKPVEIADANGRVVARVLPVHGPSSLADPLLSEEELQSREEEPEFSTAEVLARLESFSS